MFMTQKSGSKWLPKMNMEHCAADQEVALIELDVDCFLEEITLARS
jgi:hypothetical protein